MKFLKKHANKIFLLLLSLLIIVLIVTVCVNIYRLNVTLEQFEELLKNEILNDGDMYLLELKQNNIAILVECVGIVISTFLSVYVEHVANSKLNASISNVEICRCYDADNLSTESIYLLCNKNEKFIDYSNLADMKYKITIHLDEQIKGQIHNVLVDNIELKFCNNDDSFSLKPAEQFQDDNGIAVLKVNDGSKFEVTEVENSLVFLCLFNSEVNDNFTNNLLSNQDKVNINLTLYVNSRKKRFIKTRLDYKQSIKILDFATQQTY